MSKASVCPNCGNPVKGHEEDGCVLQALVGVLRDRGDIGERRLRRIHAHTDVSALWDELGDIVDRLGRGEFYTDNP